MGPERDGRPGPVRRRLGECQGGCELAEPTDRLSVRLGADFSHQGGKSSSGLYLGKVDPTFGPTGFAGYVFTPASLSLDILSSDTTAAFNAAPVVFRLSGLVTEKGSPLAGVTVTLDGAHPLLGQRHDQVVTGTDGCQVVLGLLFWRHGCARRGRAISGGLEHG